MHRKTLRPNQFVMVAILSLAGGSAIAAGGRWEDLPLFGGTAKNGIAIDPGDNDHLFTVLGGWASSGHINPLLLVESFDAGASWHEECLIPWAAAGDPYALDFLFYADADTIYAGTMRSDDNGQTWQAIDAAPGWINAVDPDNSDILYASRRPGLTFKSVNRGDDWTTMGLELTPISDAPRIFTFPDDPLRLMAMVRVSADGGAYRSTDGGATWTRTLGESVFTYAFHVDQSDSDPNILYVAGALSGKAEIYRSLDGGDTWTTVLDLPGKTSGPIAIHPQNPNVVYGVLQGWPENELYRSVDGGQSFDLFHSDTLPGGSEGTMATDLFSTTTVYLGKGGGPGIHKSVDAGLTWVEMNNGIRDNAITHIVEDPDRERVLYVSCAKGLSRLNLQTGNVNFLGGFGDNLRTILVNQVDDDIILAFPIRRISRSLDRGATWSPNVFLNTFMSGTHFQVHCGVAHPGTPGKMLVGGVRSSAFSQGGIHATYDAGATFDATPVFSGPVNCLQASGPESNAVIYGGLLSNGGGGVIKSLDLGATWTSAGLSGKNVAAIAVHPENKNTVLVAGGRFIHKTVNGGADWVDVSHPGVSVIRDIIYDPSNSNRAYFSTQSAIYRSRNGGETWEVFQDGLSNVSVLYITKKGVAPLAAPASALSLEEEEDEDPDGRLVVGANGGIMLYVGEETNDARGWDIYR